MRLCRLGAAAPGVALYSKATRFLACLLGILGLAFYCNDFNTKVVTYTVMVNSAVKR